MKMVECIGWAMFLVGMGAPESENVMLAVVLLVVGGVMMNTERIFRWIKRR